MDRIRACGACDVGSIPTEGTKKSEAFLRLQESIKMLLRRNRKAFDQKVYCSCNERFPPRQRKRTCIYSPWCYSI